MGESMKKNYPVRRFYIDILQFLYEMWTMFHTNIVLSLGNSQQENSSIFLLK